MSEKYLLSVKEVQKEFSLGRDKIYQLIRSGEIATIRIGRNTKIHRGKLQSFIDEAADLRKMI